MERLGTAATDLAHAAELLRAGKLVAFPTETVYGLGADAANPDAVAAIFAAKGRPADHPVIVHLASAASLADWADPVPEVALRLADAFWPGPLTLVLRRARGVSDRITGGQDTVGVRVPNHRWPAPCCASSALHWPRRQQIVSAGSARLRRSMLSTSSAMRFRQ